MKNLIFLGGTMGAGKTTVCRELQRLLPQNVFLDGDWCWMAEPFTVTDETKKMVQENIAFMLGQFIHCSAYQNVVFCWVMDHQEIIDGLLSGLSKRINEDVRLFDYSLVLTPEALRERLGRDVDLGIRRADVIERAVSRLPLFDALDTEKLNVSSCTPAQTAGWIAQQIIKQTDGTVLHAGRNPAEV